MKCFFFYIKQRSRFKQRTWFKGPKGRINLRESLTPKWNFGVGKGIWNQIIPEKRRIKQTESLTPKLDFGVGGGVSKQLFLTDVEDDRTAVGVAMWPDGCRKTTRRPMPELCGISLAGSWRRPDRSNLTYEASLTMDVEDDETALLKTIYLNNAKEAPTDVSASFHIYALL